MTVTRFAVQPDLGRRTGAYLMASGTGPEEREVTVSYDTAAKQTPISDKDLNACSADPYLGWETDAKFNKTGESLKVAPEGR